MLGGGAPAHGGGNSCTGRKVRIYILRHGESTGNRDGVLQGQSDYPLTVTGRRQAELAGQRLKDVRFELILASDLSRARETAEIVASYQCPREGADRPGVTTDRELREINGGARENRSLRLTMKQAIALAAAEAGMPVESFTPPPAETIAQLADRAKRFFHRLLLTDEFLPSPHPPLSRTTNDPPPPPNDGSSPTDAPPSIDDHSGRATTVLIVGHGGFLMQLYHRVFGVTGLDRVLNASLTVVDVRMGRDGDGCDVYGSVDVCGGGCGGGGGGVGVEESKRWVCHGSDGDAGSGSDGVWRPSPALPDVHVAVRCINDVQHLVDADLVTTRSTAL